MRKLFFFWVLSVLFSFVNQPEAKEVMQPLTEKEEKLVEISMYTARGYAGTEKDAGRRSRRRADRE
ncbi:MAG: hypothetical protein L6W00_20895 [Lentisphaeria bacterium]|nr:MAG: hypothetical protein L6W00_20895 [Lentisphaeria bacterium]